MGLFLSVIGFLLVPLAIVWLIINLFRKKKKLIPSLLIPAGIVLCLTGLWIVGTNATPEELAALEQKKQEKAEAKLEAERLEKEKEEEVEQKEKELAEQERLKNEEQEQKKVELAEKEKEKKKEDELKKQQQEKQRTQDEEKEKERIAKEKKEAEEKVEVAAVEKQKNENQEKLDAIIVDLVKSSDGAIKSIRPTSGDDWIAVYVTLDNSWYLLSPQEKEYLVNETGPMYSSIITASGVTDYSDVYFIDENGNTVASPKLLGGYKVKN